MRWTFDPLLRRNARFNISRLGAVGTEYLADFYGEIADGVNDPETDRLTATWDLRVPLPGSSRPAGHDGGTAAVILAADDDGEPVPGTLPQAGPDDRRRLRCWIPGDILAIRRADPALARRWRLAVRDTLGRAVGDGYLVTEVADPGWYLLDKAQAPR
jgi:predicted GNAT superfamily acetyltransferase